MHIKRIAGILRHSRDFLRVIPVARARCPVVKFVHAPSKISCDISVNNRCVVGLISLLVNIDMIIIDMISDDFGYYFFVRIMLC